MGNIFSVYIDNDILKVCEASKSGANITIKDVFQVEIAHGLVEDGLVLEPEKAAEALKKVLPANRIKHGKLAFVISSKKIAQKEVELPFVKNAAKIEEMVMANIDEYFPMNNLENYIYRHTVLDTIQKPEGKRNSILVTAVQKQMVESWYQVAEILKMPVWTVDFYSNAIYQILKKQLDQGTVLAIQMDARVTYVSIMRDKAQLFKRSIPYGYDTIIGNMADLKGISAADAKKILSDPKQAEKYLTQEEYAEMIHDFSASVTRVAEFHTSRNPGTVIESVRLLGMGTNLPSFSEALEKELGVEVIALEELTGLKIGKKEEENVTYEKLADYLPAVGALIAPLRLKVAEEKKQDWNRILYLLLGAVGIIYAVVLLVFLILIYQAKEDKKELEESIAAKAEAEQTYYSYINAQSEYAVIHDFYESTRNNNELLYQLILDLEKSMPESVGITNLATENGNVSIEGIAGGKDALAQFIIELKKLPYIHEVRVDNVSDTYDEFNRSTSVFRMTFYMMPVEPEADAASETQEASKGQTPSEGQAAGTDAEAVSESQESSEGTVPENQETGGEQE